MIAAVRKELARWVRRRRAHDVLIWGARGVVIGTGLALLILSTLTLLNRVIAVEFIYAISASGIAGGVGGGLVALLRPRSEIDFARSFDLMFGLRERVSTALEIHISGLLVPDRIAESQLEDTLAAVRAVDLRSALPLRIPIREGVALLLVAAASWGVIVQGAPFFERAERARLVQSAVDEEIETLEALAESIRTNPDLTPEEREALLEVLEQTGERLAGADSLEDAVSILAESQEQLEAISSETTSAQTENLRQTGEQLSQNAGSPLQDFGENLAAGRNLSAANDLGNLDATGMSREEQQQLAEDLSQAADSLQGQNPELAEQLLAAADALQNGDAQAADEALSEAAQTLTQAGQAAAQANTAGEAAAQLEGSQDRLIQAGRSPGDAPGQANNPGGQEGQPEGGQGGDGSPGESGGEGSGSGAGEGQSPGGDTQGEGSGPVSQDNTSGESEPTTFEPIYAPQFIDAQGGEQVTLPSAGEAGETIIGEGVVQPGAENPASVPYVEVFPAYEQAMREAIEQGFVPPALRSVVRDYFSALEP